MKHFLSSGSYQAVPSKLFQADPTKWFLLSASAKQFLPNSWCQVVPLKRSLPIRSYQAVQLSSSYLAVPTMLFLSRSSYHSVPTKILPSGSYQVVLTKWSNQAVPTKWFLPSDSNQAVPTKQFLPSSSYQAVPIKWFLPRSSYQRIPIK